MPKIRETRERWVKPVGTVCPRCGTVFQDGIIIAWANGLDSWRRKGYIPEVCPVCRNKGNHGQHEAFDFGQGELDGVAK
jgi:hypothetical protein